MLSYIFFILNNVFNDILDVILNDILNDIFKDVFKALLIRISENLEFVIDRKIPLGSFFVDDKESKRERKR